MKQSNCLLESTEASQSKRIWFRKRLWVPQPSFATGTAAPELRRSWSYVSGSGTLPGAMTCSALFPSR